jgi:hypothetical protein
MLLDSVVINEAIHGHHVSIEKKNLLIRVDSLLRFDLETYFLEAVIWAYGDGYQTSGQDLHIDLQRKKMKMSEPAKIDLNCRACNFFATHVERLTLPLDCLLGLLFFLQFYFLRVSEESYPTPRKSR